MILLAGLATLATKATGAQQQQVINCITCHSVLPAKLSNPVKLWQSSIHSEHGIACNNCHGGDILDTANAMSPASGFRGAPKTPAEIPPICGGCHMGVVKHYNQSAHGKALLKSGNSTKLMKVYRMLHSAPTCVTCHGSHHVVKASLDLINRTNCSKCHTYKKAGEIKQAMLKTEDMLMAIDKRIKVLKSQGVDTDTLEKRLFALRNRFHAMYHSLDVNKIKLESVHIQDELKKTNGISGVGTSQTTGIIAIACFLLAASLFHLIRKNLEQETTMETNEKRDFNVSAATWDEEPRRVQLARDVTAAILVEIPL